MRRGLMLLAALLAVGGFALAWRASELGIERLFVETPAGVVNTQCGSLVRPVEEPRPPCRSALRDQRVETAAVFYLAELLFLGAVWLAVTARRHARSRRWSDVLVGAAALAVSPLFLVPGQGVGFSGGWAEPTTAAQIWLFLGALPVPLAMWAFWGRRSSRTRRDVGDLTLEDAPSGEVVER